jgi:hypothetical protein
VAFPSGEFSARPAGRLPPALSADPRRRPAHRAFGCGVVFGAGAGSSFASAERSGSRRGARGNLSVSMARRIAAVTAVSSSSVRSIVGMV